MSKTKILICSICNLKIFAKQPYLICSCCNLYHHPNTNSNTFINFYSIQRMCQGSVLSPLLFIIHVNNFPHCLNESSCLSFADDTTILLSNKNTKCLFKKGSNKLFNIDNWLITNKPFLNSDKTKYMLFRTHK